MSGWLIATITIITVLIFAGALILCRKLTLGRAMQSTELFQSDLLKRQVQEVENLYRQIRGMRHDLRNHAQTMQAYLQLGQTDMLEDYLSELASSFEQVDDVLRTGNVMADAILNLLDNAMEACLRGADQEGRFLRVYIAPMKGQLYVNVTNSSPGKSQMENGRYVSSKSGRDSFARHGFGLSQIDRAAKLCGGYVNRQQEEGVFSTEIMLPL